MTLRQLRDEANLTQEEVADIAQIDQTTVSQIERGTIPNPQLGTLQGLAKAYRVSLTKVIAAHAQSVKERGEAA